MRTDSLTHHSEPSPRVLQGGCSAKGRGVMLFCGRSLAWVCADVDRSEKEEGGRRSATPALGGPLGGREPRVFTLQGHAHWTQGQTLT